VGRVQSIEPIRERPKGSGAGAVVGGVLGAVVGNQFGSGVGRAAMTGVGAVGGAVAGNNVERNHREAIVGYHVRIRLDDGRIRTFRRGRLDDLRVGDRIRLVAGSFRRE
jgi:outer membrane lipoprotein SlyB